MKNDVELLAEAYIDKIAQGPGEQINTHNEQGSVDRDSVDVHSLEIDGIDMTDYPDFVDAYFSAGQFKDGRDMSDEELEALKEQDSDLFYEVLQGKISGMGQD